MRFAAVGLTVVLAFAASAALDARVGAGTPPTGTTIHAAASAPSTLPRPTSTSAPVVAPGPGPTAAAPAVLVAVPPPPLGPGGSFFDDDASPHEADIEALATSGITRGCGDDLFCPAAPVTRGQMAAFLVRALGLRPGSAEPFEDTGASIFKADIAALAAAGITRGCSPTSFCPEDPVTRGQMAAFLVRALDLAAADPNPFVDTGGSVFESDIARLAARGITRGCNPPANDNFCPDQPVLREQMATFLTRGLDLEPRQPPPRPSLTLAFTGDILIHSPVWNAAARYGSPYDFTPMFDPVAGIIEAADLAVCHLETPLSADNRGISGYPNFNAPRQVADAVAGAGYDACSTASNHSYDRGIAGIEATLEVLQENGLAQAGMARRPEERAPSLYPVGEYTVGHISATYWLNGYRLPADRPWLVQLIDVPDILDQAAAARSAGADIVVVSVHCCTEYQTAPTKYQREVARELIASPDVDLVIGHHAHVVQPVEEVDGEYIVYGLGNFLSNQRSRASTQDGVIVTLEFARRGEGWSARGVTAYPTWVEGDSFKIRLAADHNPASWRRTAEALGLDRAAGLTVAR